MTNEDVYIKAKNAVATLRQQAITAAQNYKNSVYKNLPKLMALESEKTALCIKLATASAAAASEGEKMAITEKIKKAEQNIEQLLLQNGADIEKMNPDFICKICEDTGMQNGKMCECVHKKASEIRKNNLCNIMPLVLSNFSTFDVNKYPDKCDEYTGVNIKTHMGDVLNYCLAYADMFTTNNNSIYMCGHAGLGKTHLALAIANSVLEKGYNVVYTSAQSSFDTIEKEHFSQEGQTLKTMQQADLLILDDLGTEFISPYVSACLYSLINTRCNRLPTIYTSNIVNDADLRRRYTEKISSRLLGSCDVLTFCGDDIRIMDK